MVYFVNCVVFACRVFLLLVLHPIRTGFLTNTRQWTSLMWYRPGARLLGLAFRKSELAAGKTLASWAWLFCLALLQKAALKQPALGAIAALPARSPLLSQPRDRGPSRSNSFETAQALPQRADARTTRDDGRDRPDVLGRAT